MVRFVHVPLTNGIYSSGFGTPGMSSSSCTGSWRGSGAKVWVPASPPGNWEVWGWEESLSIPSTHTGGAQLSVPPISSCKDFFLRCLGRKKPCNLRELAWQFLVICSFYCIDLWSPLWVEKTKNPKPQTRPSPSLPQSNPSIHEKAFATKLDSFRSFFNLYNFHWLFPSFYAKPLHSNLFS